MGAGLDDNQFHVSLLCVLGIPSTYHVSILKEALTIWIRSNSVKTPTISSSIPPCITDQY